LELIGRHIDGGTRATRILLLRHIRTSSDFHRGDDSESVIQRGVSTSNSPVSISVCVGVLRSRFTSIEIESYVH
jgi:hypothetical protein